MKDLRIIISLVFVFIVGLLSINTLYAQDVTTTSDTAENISENQIVDAPVVVEQPVQKLIVYSTTTCPHCRNIKNFVSTNNVGNIEFRDVDTNAKYLEEYNALYAKYSVPENQQGVPVTEINSQIVSGDQPIIDYLIQRDNITPKAVESNIETTSSDMIFIILGGLVLFGIIGYGTYSVITKK